MLGANRQEYKYKDMNLMIEIIKNKETIIIEEYTIDNSCGIYLIWYKCINFQFWTFESISKLIKTKYINIICLKKLWNMIYCTRFISKIPKHSYYFNCFATGNTLVWGWRFKPAKNIFEQVVPWKHFFMMLWKFWNNHFRPNRRNDFLVSDVIY